MATFHLTRHGKHDYNATKHAIGLGRDLAPLSKEGVKQAKILGKQLLEKNADMIISSPMTRALQTAAIANIQLSLPLAVEFNLHEWIPKISFDWNEAEAKMALKAKKGLINSDIISETPEELKKRATNTLKKYSHLNSVIVVCHGLLIDSITGAGDLENCQIVTYQLPAN